MEIIIRKPLGYSHIGRKERQEDAVWPLFDEATDQDACFVLCDGVGGSLHGEIASKTSSEVIGSYLEQIVKEKVWQMIKMCSVLFHWRMTSWKDRFERCRW